jgi:hypothetical protein
MADGFVYHALTAEDRVTLLRDRLRRLEADHFNLDLEIRLAGVIGEADALNPQVQIALATAEAQAAALCAWIDQRETSDA